MLLFLTFCVCAVLAVPSVFNLSSRKKDFQQLLDKLAEAFLESTDTAVLNNCALALTSLAKGEHARTGDAQFCLKKTLRALQDRLLELLLVKATADNDDSKEDDDASPVNTQHSITLCLRRLATLSRRVYVAELLVDSTDTKAKDETIENLYNTVAEYAAKELKARMVVEDETSETEQVPEIWETADKRIHPLVAEAVDEALTFLVCVTAWRLGMEIELIEDEEQTTTGNSKDHIVFRMRDNLMKLVSLCFEQFMDSSSFDSRSKEHVDFSISVQKQAGRTVGDIRTLFPLAWASASSPFLRASALDEAGYDGGLFRFLRSQQDEVS
jgi:hypothetical protein